MTDNEIIGEIVEIRRISKQEEDELSIEWRIRDHLSLPRRPYCDKYESPKFRFSGERWFMTLGLYGPVDRTLNPPSERISITLIRNDSDENPTGKINVDIGVKGSGGVEMKTSVEWYSWSNSGPTDAILCSTDLIWNSGMSRQNPLVPDILTIVCDMKSIDEDLSSEDESSEGETNLETKMLDESSQDDTNLETKMMDKSSLDDTNLKTKMLDQSSQDDTNLETKLLSEVNQTSIKRGGEKANEDFAKLLASGENSDVTVQVGGVEFGVHRVILCARSPVFSAMFQHNTSEGIFNRIVVDDCEPDIFKEFLHYIYAGFVQPLTEQNVYALYRVADKYLADDLKLQCSKHIGDILNVQSFCDTVKFGLAHEENDLLKEALNFASRNILLIIRTADWQNFTQEFPAEANEILVQSLGPLNQKNAKQEKIPAEDDKMDDDDYDEEEDYSDYS